MESATFHGFSVLCAPGVLTPRPATEALVDRAVERIGDEPARVADVGTGTGAIAVAIGLLARGAEIWATDTSAAAVWLAAANVVRWGLAGRVHVVEGDLLEPIPGELDLVVANLPYLPAREEGRHPELRGEPLAALYAPGDGLGPLRRLFEQAAERLRPEGAVVYQYRGRVHEAERSELSLVQSRPWRAVAARS
jgi:release factor glutamine methyltransferase